MKDYKIDNLKGSITSTDFCHLDDNFILAYPNTPISSDYQTVLIDSNISVVFTDGNMKENAPTLQVTGSFREVLVSIKRVQEHYYTFLDEIAPFFEEVRNHKRFSYTKFQAWVHNRVTPAIKEDPHAFVLFISMTKTKDIAKITHDSDFYTELALSRLLFVQAVLELAGNDLIIEGDKILIATTACLFHISVFIMNKLLVENKKSTNVNHMSNQILPIIYKLNEQVFKDSNIEPSVENYIRNTNLYLTNFHKTGASSNRVQHSNIQFTLLCLSYLHLIKNSIFQEAMIPFKAMQTLLKTKIPIFNRVHVKKLVYILGLTPTGSVITFENGTKGIVYRTQSDDIRRPLTCVFLAKTGKIMSHPILKTINEKDTVLKEILSKKDKDVVITAFENLIT